MEGFHYLSQPSLERQLNALVDAWHSTPSEDRASFLEWAWLVARASDTFAAQNRDACAALLRDENEALDRVIRRRAARVGGESEELQSKRAFLAFLERQVETEANAA